MNEIFKINDYYLDDTQIEAIKSDAKSTLVVAGAGSGKTLTILGKIRYLIEVLKVKEYEILCISFTNETVKSLVDKTKEMGYNLDVFTFHKLGLSLLGNVSIIEDNYLDYIIDEYFESFIKYTNDKFIKSIFFTDKNTDIIYKTKEYYQLKKTISTFIRLAKSNNMGLNDFIKLYKKTFFNEKKIIKIIMDIYLIYKRECESVNKIDFDDMIINSTQKVKDKNLYYKYIIIDEFQDTSLVRYNLIHEIIKKCDSKIFVVGDDWQSIYRFSGCNLNIFVNFNQYFENTKIFHLKFTYRNSNELIGVSSRFIMKNKKQLKKSIVSNKNLEKPIKILFGYTVNDVINMIKDKDILIIGRNNSDIENIDWMNKLTIHRAKGLEANNVILVNSDNIPSTIKNEKMLRFVLNDKDYIPFEEERRLFYVALTRTKNCIYIIINKKISPFVKELIHDNKNRIEIIKK
ncbi:MAG: UvrD-helicase domain-containing protein [Erysipelotrichales bacterium]|nr:UvrD-helicase domain-containing protein [Erysipelotrichales bacterium]